MSKKGSLLSTLFFFFLAIVVILTTVDFFCFRESFYNKEYTRDQTAEKIGMSHEDLMLSTTTLLDYLKDNRDDIVVTVEVNGDEREVFNQRETLHMVDVKALYQTAVTVRNILFIACVVILVILIRNYKDELRALLKQGYINGIGLVFMCVIFLGIWAVADFNAFWTTFHEVLFDNDLWLLDPNTSIMINMFPEIFFRDLVIRIIATVLVILGLTRCLLEVRIKK